MADFNFITVADVDSIIPEVWSERLHYEAYAKQQFPKLMGDEGSGMPVIMKTELTREPGDVVKIRRFKSLTVDPATGKAKGTEEKLVPQVKAITPVLKRKPVAWEARVPTETGIAFRNLAVRQLGGNYAEFLDKNMWSVATGVGGGFSTVAPARIYSGDATSLANIDAADIFTVDDIDKAREMLEENNAKPVGGEDGYFILLVHTRQGYDLGKSAKWREYNEHADVKGLENWLYQGGKPFPLLQDPKIFGYWNGVAVMKTGNCPLTNSTGSPVIATSCGVMLGQEALARGVGSYVTKTGEEYGGIQYIEDSDDYENEFAVCAAYNFADIILTSEYLIQIVSAAVKPT